MSPRKEYVNQYQARELANKPSLLKRFKLDGLLLLYLVAISLFGLFILYSASDQSIAMVTRQAIIIGIGFVVLVIAAQIPVPLYRRTAWLLYIFGIFLLLMVLFVGVGAKGAQRWLEMPGLFRFQPSEIIKVLMPLIVAMHIGSRPIPPTFIDVVVAALIILIPSLLIGMQPDLGTAILIFASGVFVLFLAGLSVWYIVTAGAGIILLSWPIWTYMLHDYQRQRILTLLNPEADRFGAGWNIIQSKTAIGSGGLFGKGWLDGTQSQLNFLPESHTDFIIAVLAEDLGFVGILGLLVLYTCIIARGLQLSIRSSLFFNKLVSGSIILTFFGYIFVNMAMVSGIFPVVGVPLPFMSRGGTALLTLMFAFGILMAVAHDKSTFTK